MPPTESLLAAPVKCVVVGLTGAPVPGAVPAGGAGGARVVATSLGALGVKTEVVGTGVLVVNGPLVTVTVCLGVAV